VPLEEIVPFHGTLRQLKSATSRTRGEKKEKFKVEIN
jgi:hypothetical protein